MAPVVQLQIDTPGGGLVFMRAPLLRFFCGIFAEPFGIVRHDRELVAHQ